MTLSESNAAIMAAAVDPTSPDLAAYEQLLSERGIAIARFAAGASPELLAETFAAGERFQELMERVKFDSRRELDAMIRLHRGLQDNLDRIQPASEQIVCFG